LRAELALDYSYLRSNAPPDGCGCFNLNGGSATFAWTLKPEGAFALVGDITAAHAGSITSSGYGLTLSAYTVGARYQPRIGHSPWQPFGQVLVGLAHSSGSLVEGQSPATSNAGAAFAANLGGGLDLGVNRRFSFRLVEADYLVTTFDNGVNDHQNNLRLSAGVVLRF
jgi:peptidoglycan-associated lipoprotein